MGALTLLLADPVIFCRDNRGIVRRVNLGHGLQIRLYVAVESAAFHVLILRPAPTWPAVKEIETIMSHWPVPGQPKLAEVADTIEHVSDGGLNGLSWNWEERTVTHGPANQTA